MKKQKFNGYAILYYHLSLEYSKKNRHNGRLRTLFYLDPDAT